MAWVMSARPAHNLHHGLQTPDGVSQQPQYPDRSHRKQHPLDQSPPASAPASANISGSASTLTENFPPTPTASAVQRRSGQLLKSCLLYWRSATPTLAADQRHRKRDSQLLAKNLSAGQAISGATPLGPVKLGAAAGNLSSIGDFPYVNPPTRRDEVNMKIKIRETPVQEMQRLTALARETQDSVTRADYYREAERCRSEIKENNDARV
ncbi:hypothetical protein [Tardiphaga sp. 813_E8_N1_3]|uniref:hypothetical protein n=1 Tax=Tardiphaga sp. 813_E8_N1_3 TaxID=3240760 RepID=UPI003F1FDB33